MSKRSTKILPFHGAIDQLALSCLLLAVEWGDKFTDVPRHQMETNRKMAAVRREPSWYDQLPWELCQASSMVTPPETVAVERLTVNLDHHIGSIRCWMMEIGWIVRSWLTASEAMPLLLKNLADTLGGPFKAAGLAVALVSTADEFWALARDFKYDRFAEQYARRLKLLEEHGIFDIQASFWKLEAQCRKVIADAVLGLRLVPPGRAALALMGQPEATNEQIAQLSKIRPEETHQVDRPSKQTVIDLKLVRVLEKRFNEKWPHLADYPKPAPVNPAPAGPEDLGPTSTGPTSQGWKDARKLAQLWAERDPGSPAGQKYLPETPTWSDGAVALEKAQDWPGLLTWCRRWTQAESGDEAAWFVLGFAYFHLGRHQEEIEAYREVLRLKPDHDLAWNNLGGAYRNLGRHQDAIEAYRETLRFKPADRDRHFGYDNAVAWYALAIAYGKSGNRSAALEAVQQLRRLDPKMADKLLNLFTKP